MAWRSAQVAGSLARVGTSGLVHPSGCSLLGSAPTEAEPETQTERPERLICLSVGRFIFTDPKWGPQAFDISVWRHLDEDLPNYEVVVE